MSCRGLLARGGLFVVALAATGALANCQKQAPPPADPLQEGVAAFKQGHFDQAIAAYQRAIASQPRNYVAYNLLGMAYRFKYNQAPSPALKEKEIAAFTKSLELKPDYVVALVNLGASYYYSGRQQQAAPLFAKALELMPNHPDAANLKKMIAGAGSAGGPAPDGGGRQPAAAPGREPAAE